MFNIDDGDNENKESTNKPNKKKAPKMLMIFRVIAFIFVIAGAVLLVAGLSATVPEMSASNWFEASSAKNGTIFGGIALIMFSAFFFFIGFMDKISSASIKLNKHIIEENKDDLTSISETASDIGIKGSSQALKNNKKSIYEAVDANSDSIRKIAEAFDSKEEPKEYKYCSDCGKKITKEAKFCSFCGKKQD